MARKPAKEPRGSAAARGTPPLREQAYESFTRHLLAQDVRPGQFVSQRELVELTGMPLGAIRELVPRLEADGLMTTVPQRGMQIAHVDLKLVKNAFQLRSILEIEAARHFVRCASDAEIDGLMASHLEVIDAARKAPVSEALVLAAQAVDWSLHDRFIDSFANEIISNVYRVNSIKIRLIRQERVRLEPALLLPVMKDHMAILDALKRRDEDAVVATLKTHLTSARNRALGV